MGPPSGVGRLCQVIGIQHNALRPSTAPPEPDVGSVVVLFRDAISVAPQAVDLNQEIARFKSREIRHDASQRARRPCHEDEQV